MALSRRKERERAIMTESRSGAGRGVPVVRRRSQDKKTDFLLLSVCFSWAHGDRSLDVDFSQPRSAQQYPRQSNQAQSYAMIVAVWRARRCDEIGGHRQRGQIHYRWSTP